MNISRLGSALACAGIFALLLSGCSLLGGKRKPAEVQIKSLRMSTNAPGGPILMEVLQTEVMRLADAYAATVAQAVDDYSARNTNAAREVIQLMIAEHASVHWSTIVLI